MTALPIGLFIWVLKLRKLKKQCKEVDENVQKENKEERSREGEGSGGDRGDRGGGSSRERGEQRRQIYRGREKENDRGDVTKRRNFPSFSDQQPGRDKPKLNKPKRDTKENWPKFE